MAENPETESPNNLRVLIACGGTGGHLFPGIAIAEELRARGHEAAVVVSEKKIDEIVMGDHHGIPAFKLPAIASPSLFSPRMLVFGGRFAHATWKARSVILGYSPHVVLGMGGFTSMPVIVAARMLNLPSLLHESNAVPGRANRLGASFASTVLLGWEAARPRFRHADLRTVGTPIRQGIDEKQDRAACGKAFGLDPDRPTLLVIGGSQGARGLNRLVTGALPALAKGLPDLQLIHLAGPTDFEEVQRAYQGCELRHHVAPFSSEMAKAYAISDLVVARSGASTLNELAAVGLPAILVPYPHAADRHQHANAEIFTSAGAAHLADEADTTSEDLAGEILRLLADKAAYGSMAEAMNSLSPADATGRICEVLEEVAS